LVLGKSSTYGKKNAGKAIIGAFVLTIIIKIFILDFMIAEGNSMFPAIKPGTILPVCKAFYGIRLPGSQIYLLQWDGPKEGDVVVFYTPLGELVVKRCGEILPGNAYYFIGDNISQSYDSRNYGPIPKSQIIGKVIGK
jgi:signal peptidase I